MIKLIKNINYFFIGFLKIIFLSKWKSRHNQFKTNNQEVIILANGPSLSGLLDDPEFLKRIDSCDKVCVNQFHTSPIFETIRPQYYVIVAPSYFVKETKPEYVEMRTKLFNDLAEKVSWNMLLFIPFQAKKTEFWKQIISKNEHIKIVYFNVIAFEGSSRFLNFVFGRKLGMPRLHNVCGSAIMNSIWLGYKDIYLTGVEHSWLPMVSVTEDNVALVNQPHFYDKDTKPAIMNDQAQPRKLHEILHKFYVSFKGYFDIKAFATKKKVRIINLTKGSFIDAFEKKPISYFINRE